MWILLDYPVPVPFPLMIFWMVFKFGWMFFKMFYHIGPGTTEISRVKTIAPLWYVQIFIVIGFIFSSMNYRKEKGYFLIRSKYLSYDWHQVDHLWRSFNGGAWNTRGYIIAVFFSPQFELQSGTCIANNSGFQYKFSGKRKGYSV